MSDSLPCPTDPADWMARRQELRATEWALHHEVLAAARAALNNLQENSHKTTAQEIARLLELASRLGRLACGLEPGSSDDFRPALLIEVSTALKRIYSQPIDVLAEKLAQPAAASPATDSADDDASPPPDSAQP